ncbi:thiamine diphosphokinase [Fodinibius salinus]|uniref:Thiamine diphosphokinase n=1 Tax=Fodinibius salinus TaxID=860790 RepID=A0A5D3YK51_9BACT|nr:thiamine diphosphokinase [Fodinibius salinus]TYP93922.1 thiamine diphosphokinase [Fodinibius salinus]
MKRALILCNGRPPNRSLFREYRAKADLFIAADGGGNIARDFDAHPDLIIGDLDSFIPYEDESFETLKKSDQESNDLEKALSYLRNRKTTHVDILAATGQRIDQTLKNISVLKQFNPQFEQLFMIDDYGVLQLIPKSFSTDLPKGTTVSLFPLSGKADGIITEGLKYPLEDEIMENGVRDGSSNKVVENPIKISYKNGDLLMFISHKKFEDSL